MHISITGRLGSGKSTVCGKLSARHGFRVYSTGAIQREIALRKMVSTLEMNQLMAQNVSLDHEIDDAVTGISVERKDETIIFDSRMAWKFAVNSFKVFVTADPLVAAGRVLSNPRGKEEVYTDIEDAKSKLIERGRLENERFIDIYGVDYFDYSNYDLVVDSTYITPDELTDIVDSKFQSYCGSNTETREIILSPRSVYPLAASGNIDGAALRGFIENRGYLRSLISVAVYDGYHFIADGHHRALAAIINNERFIGVNMADTEKYPLYRSAQNLVSRIHAAGMSSAREFEKIGKFRYKSYPPCYSAHLVFPADE